MSQSSLIRPSLSRPSLSRSSLSRPSLSRPSLSRPSLSRPFFRRTNRNSSIITSSRLTQSIPLINFPPLHNLPHLDEITIPSSTEVIDVVYGNINFAYYVDMSNETSNEIPEMDRSDNIVFYFNNYFQGVQKARLRELIENRTGESGIYYECIQPNNMNPNNVVKNNPLFYLRKVSSISYFVPANEILTILNSNDKLYTLHNKIQDLASVVSQSVYDRQRLGNGSVVSASHCQPGQEGELYSLAVKPFRLETKGGKKFKTNKKSRKINKKTKKMNKKSKKIN
jgi:hypothetical protein